MRCPTCDVNLIDGDRPNVTSGYCPECQGEWFARGAVDRLLDRALVTRCPEPAGPHGCRAGAVLPAGGDRREGLWNWF